jgi:hypothetical protein
MPVFSRGALALAVALSCGLAQAQTTTNTGGSLTFSSALITGLNLNPGVSVGSSGATAPVTSLTGGTTGGTGSSGTPTVGNLTIDPSTGTVYGNLPGTPPSGGSGLVITDVQTLRQQLGLTTAPSGGSSTITVTATVPEPATWALMSLMGSAIAALTWRRRRA